MSLTCSLEEEKYGFRDKIIPRMYKRLILICSIYRIPYSTVEVDPVVVLYFSSIDSTKGIFDAEKKILNFLYF